MRSINQQHASSFCKYDFKLFYNLKSYLQKNELDGL